MRKLLTVAGILYVIQLIALVVVMIFPVESKTIAVDGGGVVVIERRFSYQKSYWTPFIGGFSVLFGNQDFRIRYKGYDYTFEVDDANEVNWSSFAATVEQGDVIHVRVDTVDAEDMPVCRFFK